MCGCECVYVTVCEELVSVHVCACVCGGSW